jgi:NitT/TauT family transport system permease protein
MVVDARTRAVVPDTDRFAPRSDDDGLRSATPSTAGSGQRLDEEIAGLDALELRDQDRRSRLVQVWSSAWPKLAAVALGLAVWQIVVWTKWKPEYALPGPRTVFAQLGHDMSKRVFYKAIVTTMLRAAKGYALAVLIGSIVGAAVARVRVLRTAVGSLITGLQTMPSIVWFPLAVLLFKLSEGAIAFVVVLGAAPSIANGLIGGVDHVPPLLLRAGHTLGAGRLALFRHVIMPASVPSYLGGLKQGWAFAWRSLMAGELIVNFGKPSIGARLDLARQLSDAPDLIATMIVILVIGLAVDAVFARLDLSVRSRRGLVSATAL